MQHDYPATEAGEATLAWNSGRAPVSSASPALILERFLPYQLNTLALLVSEGLEKHYRERYGIDIPQWRVLATLGQYGALTAKAIGGHSLMNKTKVSRAVAGLEQRGLLARRRNNSDMRKSFLTLTPEGRRIYADIVPMARRYSDDLCGVLSEQERAVFQTCLNTLLAHWRRG